MGKKWIEALVQDVQKVELQKERKNSYTIYDPKGVGADKVKSIMLMLTDGEGIGNLNPVQQKKESFYKMPLRCCRQGKIGRLMKFYHRYWTCIGKG